MDNIHEMYKKRNERSMSLIKDAFEFKKLDDVPYIINNANYFLFGYSQNEIPKDYITNPGTMYKRQISQFENHYNLLEDNYVPYLMPWFGTGVLASAFGVKINFLPKMDPATEGNAINNVDDIDKLKVPDLQKDGLLQEVLKRIKYFKENSKVPTVFTDIQGPLVTSIQIVGYENFFYWMHDYPKKIHQLMDLTTEVLIEWVKIQKKIINEPIDHCFGDQGVYIPEGTGIWLADDDAILLSERDYKEFVVPYNDKIFKEFGSGIIHYCGCANQHIDNFLSMKYLRALNVFSLADWRSLLELKRRTEGHIIIIASDFTPVDFENYYKNLFEKENISKKGLILQSLFAPTTGVVDKKYLLLNRDEKEILPKLNATFKKYLQ